jgi:phytoene dehydrogenase-like protein
MGHYIVIGGGIAGLTAANALASSGSVTLLEKSHQLGGRGRTLDVNGYRLNLGPHALVADWKMIAAAQLKTDKVDQLRAQLGNEIAIKAFKGSCQ